MSKVSRRRQHWINMNSVKYTFKFKESLMLIRLYYVDDSNGFVN